MPERLLIAGLGCLAVFGAAIFIHGIIELVAIRKKRQAELDRQEDAEARELETLLDEVHTALFGGKRR